MNLLSWREARRRSCVRFWAMMFSGLWLAAILQIVTGRLAHTQFLARQEVYRVNESALSALLANKEKALREQHLRWAAAQAHELRRKQTANWEAMLLTLAEKLPEQAWLTALQWQGNQFSLAGMAMRFPALSSVDQMVKSLPGFVSVMPGPTRQDKQGRWQFSYQLRVGDTDVSAR
ncbi:MAG: PilN domain-containing protein [Scandinavium sp.]|uniref:PilN domain-containing protein n=1 Tax=Scandinavium sp. TaxID=2830653 RepID=UPI003F30EDF4